MNSNASDPLQPGTPAFEGSREELEKLLHGYVDLVLDAFSQESIDPVLQKIHADEVQQHFDAGPPMGGEDPSALLLELRETLAPASRKNGHPRFFAYVCASVDPVGAVFDGVASLFNQNVTAWRSAPGAVAMERQVLAWLGELTGFGGGGQGLLVSGGSMANATALACALGRKANQHGSETAQMAARLTVYVSSEAHVSMPKACRLLGLPVSNVRVIPTGPERTMDLAALALALGKDLAEGYVPACVCATLGTVNTGAVDDLVGIAKFALDRDVWMHVDGAYGGPVAMLSEFSHLHTALKQADSFTLDPHKWLFAPIGVGCLLLKEEQHAKRAFRFDAEYTKVVESGDLESLAFFDLGFEMSRPNRALRVWAILKTRGVDAIAAEIQRQIRLREWLDECVEKEADLEPLGSGLSVACFRFLPVENANEEATRVCNEQILSRLVEGGHFYLSATQLDGRYALRICIVNFRTQRQDMTELVARVCALGREWISQNGS